MPDLAERALRTRIARSEAAIGRSFADNLFYIIGRTFEDATIIDFYTALAYTIRDRMLARLIASDKLYKRRGAKTVAYLSAEFLPGPHLENNILNLNLWGAVREAMSHLNLDLEAILDAEQEPGLGNGGLGRLAACYMDSLATLEIPAIGYGIRYEYGIFEQAIRDGWQVEVADVWLRNGNPWELPRQHRYAVRFGGHVEHYSDEEGHQRVRWLPESTIYGIAYDTPILGYGVLNVNLLRLWKSEARESFDLQAFNLGDYYGAVNDMVSAQNISKVLYPNDEPAVGKALRLRQQYFFVSCSLQDMIRLTVRDKGSIEHFPDRFVVQLNDTHPAVSIAEFMRLLVDEYLIDWDRAWSLTRRSFAYTNHTLLPEALETWPEDLFKQILPRHLEIIYEINARFLDHVRVRFFGEPGEPARLARLSLIDEGIGDGVRRVRMANLACVGSMAINGVAELHTDLLKHTVLKDFHEMWPEKFRNKTNGVTPRRFIALANPPLAALLEETVGEGWLRRLEQLRGLESYSQDGAFRERWRAIKRVAKERLAGHVRQVCGILLDPDTLFDIQVKRIHEYKRQHLNVLHIISLYQRLKRDPSLEITPRTFVFGGKAAPGYRMAKLIIKLINSVADVINRDNANNKLRVVFVPDFNVKTGERIYPAADLSEQISTAGKEASGTGNMKFTMNGALTIGTLDGANVEIREAVGSENFFLFGKTVQQVEETRAAGYHPREVYESDEDLRGAIDLINAGLFSHGDRDLFRPLTDSLLDSDPFLVCADFRDYVECQGRVALAYRDAEQWSRMSILNVARCGRFSSDRAIREYSEDIWNVVPLKAEKSKG
ncbi:MAG TPA: glycogen/starch/alpha-glucan phosphorylase [Blastocatellia bacterium]|nr:glycogen/starch/alpha-glucan phosphorylase [Blastocatellia bacterium]